MKFRCAQRLIKFIGGFLQELIQGAWAMSLKTTKGNEPFSSIFHEFRAKKLKETSHFHLFFMSFDKKKLKETRHFLDKSTIFDHFPFLLWTP